MSGLTGRFSLVLTCSCLWVNVRLLCNTDAGPVPTFVQRMLLSQGVASDGPLTGWDILIQLFPSANHLLGNVESIASMLTPLAGPKVAILLRKTISDLFQTYTSSMSAGFQKHQQPDGSYPYNLGMLSAKGTLCVASARLKSLSIMSPCCNAYFESCHSLHVLSHVLSFYSALLPIQDDALCTATVPCSKIST